MSNGIPGAASLCFVLMPFGRKPNPTPPPAEFDFDAIYRDLIAPAIVEAKMQPLRADEEISGGLIHQPMYERLILCEFAVADLTAANANVFYELGIRHAVRPWSTILIFAEGVRLPFDVAPLRGIRYKVDQQGKPTDVEPVIDAIKSRLVAARDALSDSPLFQSLVNYAAPDLRPLKPQSFLDRARETANFQDRLKKAVNAKQVEALKQIEGELDDLKQIDSAIITALFYSYRSLNAFDEMVRLFPLMPEYVSQGVSIREQYAFALNRIGNGSEAEEVLLRLLERTGPNSETYGILGRIYKDRWNKALGESKQFLANGHLSKAIETYTQGFDADPRDYYPGVNAVTLMIARDPKDPGLVELLPAVRYALARQMRGGRRGYWEYATALELAIHANDQQAASTSLAGALAAPREPWMGPSTADNLRSIRLAREKRGDSADWIQEIEKALTED